MPPGAGPGRGDGRHNSGDRLTNWAQNGLWGAVRDELAQKGFNLNLVGSTDPRYDTPGFDLKKALEFYVNGKSSKAYNSMIYDIRQGRKKKGDRQPPGRPLPNPVGGGGGGGGAGIIDTGSAAEGLIDPTSGMGPVDYESFLGMGGNVPGLVSVGTLMGRNPFGKGFGFNPVDYASAVTKQKYDPMYQAITNRIKQEQEMNDAAQGRIAAVYDPIAQQIQQRSAASQATDAAMAERLTQLAGSLGEGVGADAANLLGFMGGESQSNTASNEAILQDANRQKANMVMDFTAQKDQSVRDLRDQRLELNAARGDEYKANLLQGIQARQDLLTSAVANRGALFSQEMSRAMGRPTLAISNIQAQQAMDDLLRARQNGEIDRQTFNAQMQQLQQTAGMDALAARQMEQQLVMGDLGIQGAMLDLQNQGGQGPTSIGLMKPDQRSQLWQFLAGNYTSLNQSDPDTPVALNNTDAISALYEMALGSGAIQVGNERQRKDLLNWLRQMTGYRGNVNDLYKLAPGGGGYSGSGQATTSGGGGGNAAPAGPKVYRDKNGRRYRIGARGGRVYIDK
jgi:hypothetical protein